MNKKIHITESQLKEIFKRINEEVRVDATANVEEKGAANGLRDAAGDAVKNGLKPNDTTFTINGETASRVNEDFKKLTKKEIKEARLQKLVKESVKLVRKKDLK
jgi:hypothetical protein